MLPPCMPARAAGRLFWRLFKGAFSGRFFRGAFLKITDKKQFFAGYSVIKVAKPLCRGRTDSSLRQGGKPQSASSSSSGPLISLTVDSTSFLVFIFIRPIFISGVHASTTEESATSTMCARKIFSEA